MDVSPSPLARLHVQGVQHLDDHGEEEEATGCISVRKEGKPRSNSQAQVRRRVSNLPIHPEEQTASVLLIDELRRESQVQFQGHPDGLYDHDRRAL
jgi:hypothetical protein